MAEADPATPNAERKLRAAEHPQHAKLEAAIAAANRALPAASRGELFASRAGAALINALHDLTEVDALYDLAGDIFHQLRITREGLPLDRFGDARW